LQENPHVQQKWIQTLLRSKGFIVPNYELPPNVEKEEILRVVIREQFSEDLVERLVSDIIEVSLYFSCLEIVNAAIKHLNILMNTVRLN